MSIGAVSSVAGALVAGGVQAAAGQRQAAAAVSAFGPASLLSGSTQDFTQGLYNSLSTLLAAGKTRITAGASASASASQKQRAQALESAVTRIDAGDTRGGRAIAEGLLAKNGNDVAAMHLVAHSHLTEGDYKQAERYYARASALAPDNARLKSDLANVRTLQKNDDEVLAEARRQIKSPAHRTGGLRLLLYLSDRRPADAQVYLALADGFAAARQPLQVIGALQEAVKHADQNQIDEVITRAEKLVEDHSEVGLPHNILGRALQKAGRLGEAIIELEAATNIAPDNTAYRKDLAGGYIARAQAKLAAGSMTSAETDLQTARSIDPGNSGLAEPTARVAAHRAGRYITGGLYNRALGELNTAAAKAPNDAGFKKKLSALYIRVAARFQNQDMDSQALSSYIKAYELDPTAAVARRNVAELSHQEGLDAMDRLDYDGAITHLDRAYQTYRANVTYRQDLARAYDLRGQFRMSLSKLDLAIEDFKKGVILDPSNTSLNANLSTALTQSSGT